MFSFIKQYIKDHHVVKAMLSKIDEINDLVIELNDRSCLQSMPLEHNPLDEPIISSIHGYRLGFFANMANNHYIMVRALNRRGINCTLYYEPGFSDSYPMSHPAWEDRSASFNEIPTLKKLAERWTPPPYCVECQYGDMYEIVKNMDQSSLKELMSKCGIEINDLSTYFKIRGSIGHFDIWKGMNESDVLHVTGNMIGLASLTNKPYVTFPFGGDLYITPFQNHKQGWLQVQGFRRAEMHIASGKLMVDYLLRLGIIKEKIALLPLMFDTDEYAPAGVSSPLRMELVAQYPGKLIFFSGARQNWTWKGNDKFYRALARIKNAKDRIVIISTWWGQDTRESDELIKKLGISDMIKKTGILTKRALHEYIDAADVCVDQFTLGSIGTSSLEAMSHAKPLLAFYDKNKHFSFDDDAPIINVTTEDQIHEALVNVCEGKIDLMDLGFKARNWMIKYHSINALWPEYDAVYKIALAQHRARR